jgi:hypothetical protein
MDKLNAFLDRFVLPWPVRFLTFRFVILATIALLIPLIVFAANTTLVLSINSYLNTMSVAVSSIVLLYATISEVRQKQIAALQEKRAREDHAHVTEMHKLLLEAIENQRQEIGELKRLVSVSSGEPCEPPTSRELPNLKQLHPRGEDRFHEHELDERWEKALHHNALVSTLRADYEKTDDDY